MINIIIVVLVVLGVILVYTFFNGNNKCIKAMKQSFMDNVIKYPDIDPSYVNKINLSLFKNSSCVKDYKVSKDCQDLTPCSSFIPYFCSIAGRKHYISNVCKGTPEEITKCTEALNAQTHVYETIDCNEMNTQMPFPLLA